MAALNKTESRLCDRPAVRQAILDACCAKSNRLLPLAGHVAGRTAIVCAELVVLIDTSDSMRDDVDKGLIQAACDAVEQVHALCDTELHVHWLGIEEIWPDSPFRQSYRSYLVDMGIPESDLRGRRKDSLPHQGAQEDGARAIMDIATHFRWKQGAWRGILYLGDEALEGGNPVDGGDIAIATQAAALARECAVTVFTYAGSGRDGKNPDLATEIEYLRLAQATGGKAYRTPNQNLERFSTDLIALIGPSDDETGVPGGPIHIPFVQPCFALRWGDSHTDHFETDDRETVEIVACNNYTNVIFHDLTLVSSQLRAEGNEPIPPLPDGTPSAMVTPARMIDFGMLNQSSLKNINEQGRQNDHQSPDTNVDSSNPLNSDDLSKVVRSVEFISRGSKPGPYTYEICCQYRAEIILSATEEFALELIPS